MSGGGGRLRRIAAVLAAALWLLAGGCSTRDPLNPLDPRNPATGGEPQWLSARADQGAVDLSWRVPDYRDLLAVHLRAVDRDSLLVSGAGREGTFRDGGLPDGVTRRYRLELVTRSGAEVELPGVEATPGPAVPWVYAFGSGEVVRATPDGRAARLRIPDPAALTLVADPDSGGVLVVDFYDGAVRRLDRNGEERWADRDLARPIRALRTRQGWWVADPGAGAVVLLDAAGERIYADSSFTYPVDLAPAGDGAVWVADQAGPLVRLALGAGSTDTLAAGGQPYAVAAAGDGGAWLVDRSGGRLLRVDAGAEPVRELSGWGGVETLVPDPVVDGGVWVADRARRRVVLLDGEGGAVTVIPGLPAPSSIDVSPEGDEIWVADSALGELVRFDRNGAEIARSRGLSSPTAVSVAFHPALPTP